MAKKTDAYRINGRRVPGVTTITNVIDKPGLMFWAVNQAIKHVQENFEEEKPYKRNEIESILKAAKRAHQDASQSAADAGSDIHHLIEMLLKGQLEKNELKGDDKKVVERFEKATDGYTWLGSEIVLLNYDLEYGGTADALAQLPDGRFAIVDVKTSNNVYATHSLQLAMYAEAEPVQQKDIVDKWKSISTGIILHFNKDRRTWEILERDIDMHRPYVPHVRNVYEWKKEFDS